MVSLQIPFVLSLTFLFLLRWLALVSMRGSSVQRSGMVINKNSRCHCWSVIWRGREIHLVFCCGCFFSLATGPLRLSWMVAVLKLKKCFETSQRVKKPMAAESNPFLLAVFLKIAEAATIFTQPRSFRGNQTFQSKGTTTERDSFGDVHHWS